MNLHPKQGLSFNLVIWHKAALKVCEISILWCAVQRGGWFEPTRLLRCAEFDAGHDFLTSLCVPQRSSSKMQQLLAFLYETLLGFFIDYWE